MNAQYMWLSGSNCKHRNPGVSAVGRGVTISLNKWGSPRFYGHQIRQIRELNRRFISSCFTFFIISIFMFLFFLSVSCADSPKSDVYCNSMISIPPLISCISMLLPFSMITAFFSVYRSRN
ncbi:uncharacterized protein LOC122196224 [Lactuca sativa]|uniref:uncharacterized protein LOC122196224 n=1 Tax=Lactuca sativa TaxID=4236 RepID=UPI001C68AB40|nr:uncharacterized protein LOC122196224 [Lactuca sativa]